MAEEPSIVYGRLVESVHLAGYTFERAWKRLEWLLVGNRWQTVGSGYTDINTFLATIKLPEGITPERRKTVAARIKALQPEASQRKIAGALGVSNVTIHNDLSPGVKDLTPDDPSPPPEAIDTQGGVKDLTPAPVAHVSHNSGEQEWYTPLPYIEAARQVLGAIDLDPASTPAANQVVQATCFYSQAEDGLGQPWQGRVWMNPPYTGELVGQFVHKLCTHLASGEVPAAIVLVNNATETTWFTELAAACPLVCFPQGRVRFLSPSGERGAPLQGQAVLYSGPDPGAFAAHFGSFGCVWRRV